MTKSELREKIKSAVLKTQNKNVDLDMGDSISLDSMKFPVLGKFPQLKKVIIELLTNQYEIFLTDIQWVAPRPTTFRIILGNGESFYLVYTNRSWIAKIEGKKYYLLNISEEEHAAESIARILSYGFKEETDKSPEDIDTGFDDEFESEVPEINPADIPTPEDAVPEETPEEEA